PAGGAGRAERVLGAIILAQALTLAVSGPTSSPEYLPLRVADAEGYFAKEGLTVTVKTTRAEPGAAEALAQGQADLAATSLEAMLRFGPRTSKQAPRLVLGLTAAPLVALVVAEAQKDVVRSVEDLSGKRVGMTAPGAPEQAWFAWLLARVALSPAQVSLVSRGDRGLSHAVETGDVDAALLREPAASRLLAAGQARLLVDLRTPSAVRQALGGVTVNAAVFMRADRMVRDRDLAAFTRAILAAERRIATATAEALTESLPASITAPPEDFDGRLEACRELYLPEGVVSVEQVRQTLTLIRSHVPLPVMTSWVRPRSARSIVRASSASAGLPRARPSITTIVSAPSTSAAVRDAATVRAFLSARRATASGRATASSVSSTSLAMTSNGTPSDASSSRRRGEAEARIRGTSRPPYQIGGMGEFDSPMFLDDDQRMGVGDDSRLGVDRRADVLRKAERVLVCQPVPVAQRRARQPLGDELVDHLRALGPRIDLLGGGDEAPRRTEAGDERLVGRDHREDL